MQRAFFGKRRTAEQGRRKGDPGRELIDAARQHQSERCRWLAHWPKAITVNTGSNNPIISFSADGSKQG
jgi:hypothetical protein